MNLIYVSLFKRSSNIAPSEIELNFSWNLEHIWNFISTLQNIPFNTLFSLFWTAHTLLDRKILDQNPQMYKS